MLQNGGSSTVWDGCFPGFCDLNILLTSLSGMERGVNVMEDVGGCWGAWAPIVLGEEAWGCEVCGSKTNRGTVQRNNVSN